MPLHVKKAVESKHTTWSLRWQPTHDDQHDQNPVLTVSLCVMVHRRGSTPPVLIAPGPYTHLPSQEPATKPAGLLAAAAVCVTTAGLKPVRCQHTAPPPSAAATAHSRSLQDPMLAAVWMCPQPAAEAQPLDAAGHRVGLQYQVAQGGCCSQPPKPPHHAHTCTPHDNSRVWRSDPALQGFPQPQL
jgi:hypothetical protein